MTRLTRYAYRIALVAWALTGIDIAALLLTMSPTDLTGNYERLVWFCFSLELMWTAATVVVMIAAALWLVRALRVPR